PEQRPELPHTGASIETTVLLGCALMLSGIALTILTRKKGIMSRLKPAILALGLLSTALAYFMYFRILSAAGARAAHVVEDREQHARRRLARGEPRRGRRLDAGGATAGGWRG
ncbi:MAG: LPXTG cell wall anchor domain-containing protein, partial [Thermoplasmatota archaeon]